LVIFLNFFLFLFSFYLSVLVRIHAFLPYLYIPVPSFWIDKASSFRELYNQKLAETGEGKSFTKGQSRDLVLDVLQFESASIYGYARTKIPFFKIYVPSPRLIPTLRGLLEKEEMTTYESNIPFVLRFLIDRNISGCNWVECPAGEYTICKKKESTCQIEVNISYDKLISHSSFEEPYGDLAPLRILSFDIECCGRKGHFPEPDQDPVIQIANYVTLQGKYCTFPSFILYYF
jgi:DNA polymerase delta subunit 1